MSKIIPPFQAIYIIDETTGLTLKSENFGKDLYDADLISGMFKALDSFINHMAYSRQFQLIKEINLNGIRIIYEKLSKNRPLLGIAISNKENSLEWEHLSIKYLLSDFYQTYYYHLEQFYGNVKIFRDYQFPEELGSQMIPKLRLINATEVGSPKEVIQFNIPTPYRIRL